MKLSEKIDYGFESGQKFHNNYSFFDKDLRIKQLKNQRFIVPWEMVEKEEKEILVE